MYCCFNMVSKTSKMEFSSFCGQALQGDRKLVRFQNEISRQPLWNGKIGIRFLLVMRYKLLSQRFCVTMCKQFSCLLLNAEILRKKNVSCLYNSLQHIQLDELDSEKNRVHVIHVEERNICISSCLACIGCDKYSYFLIASLFQGYFGIVVINPFIFKKSV